MMAKKKEVDVELRDSEMDEMDEVAQDSAGVLPDPRLAQVPNMDRFLTIPPPEPAETARGYIKHVKKIDTFNIQHVRVPYTMSVCPICGVDLVDLNKGKLGASVYEDLLPQLKAAVDATLVSHVTERHGADEPAQVVDKSLLSFEWLRTPLAIGENVNAK